MNADIAPRPPGSVLVATLGHSWPVIPEVAAVLAPLRCPLYRHRRQATPGIPLDALQNPPDAIWVIASGGSKPQWESLQHWNRQLAQPFEMRIFVAAHTRSVSSADEIARLRELTHRVMLLASARGPVFCSLAGGRKTMSADLQHAASLFGCAGLLHVVAPDALPEALRSDDPHFWAQPLSTELADCLQPVWLGRHARSEVLGTPPQLLPDHYPLGVEDAAGLCVFDHDSRLCDELAQRLADARQLLHNYVFQLDQHEGLDNWRQLYRLAPDEIELLRCTPLQAQHEPLLRGLPKAELHCHLGGLPTLAQQRLIGRAVWDALAPRQRNEALAQVGAWIDQAWPPDWPQQLRAGPRAALSAALLTQAREETLHHELFETTEPRVGLKARQGFAAYERPAELSGSALLGHPAALHAYCDAVRAYARCENLLYLELRGSPHKYASDPVAWLQALRRALPDDAQCRYRFIWIADRRQPASMGEVVRNAVAAHQREPGFLVGLDLAGDEGTQNPAALAQHFLPAHQACLPITIHAGEGESPENIWHAAYALHADRIGHGLTLAEKPDLLARFRNRGICLELCPSSNREVVGFADPAFPHSRNYPRYPLAQLLAQGIAITLNSDNPGISRTGLTQEFVVAARMSRLTWWQALSISHTAFRHAFLDARQRSQVLNAADYETQAAVRDLLPHLSAESFPNPSLP